MPPKRSRPYHHGYLSDALLDATLDLLNQGGIEAVTLRAVAKEVGVSPSSSFRHFRDKRDLLTKLAVRSGQHLIQELETARQQGETAAARLRRVQAAYFSYAFQQPAAFKMIFREELINIDDPDYRLVIAGIARTHDKAVRAVLPEDMESVRRTKRQLAAWAQLHGLTSLVVEGPLDEELPADVRIPFLLETLEESLRLDVG